MALQAICAISRVLVVDDHPLFCDALAMTLKSVPGVTEVRAVHTLAEALELFPSAAAPDVVLLDLNLPDVTGLDGLARLRSKAGAVPILVVSSMADNRMISSVLRAGAQGFVPKHSQRDTLIAAFQAVASGDCYRPEGFQDVPEDAAPNPEDPSVILKRLSTLTTQQARILQLICAGKLNKQIAYDLSIAETTVKAHVTAIMRKLGVQSRTQAVVMAGKASFDSILPEGGQPA